MLARPGRSPRSVRLKAQGCGEGPERILKRSVWTKAHRGMEKWVLKLARGDQERWEAMRFGLDLVVDYDKSILSEARKMG